MNGDVGKSFRKDINGLRAWAVLAVVGFHFGVPGLEGGFAGVDVFFVISGYLMTGIVVAGLERGNFSFWRFMLARALRIVPALALVCGVLLALGWFAISASEYEALGGEVVSSLAFVSNLLFWKQAGYFDAAAHDKWLLHTWSLSLEWQFYIALPLALMAAWKLRPERAGSRNLLLGAAVVSAAICAIATPINPIDAFYLLPARAWELLLGGCVWLWRAGMPGPETKRRALEACGFVLVLAAILLFDRNTPWPGWAAWVPAGGAALILVSARQDSLWTSAPGLQWIGLRSYSIYLWHWPATVGLGYLQLGEDWRAAAAGLLLVLVMSHFSYRYVEVFFRIDGGRKRPIAKTAGMTALAVAAAGFGAGVVARDGLPGRLPAAVERAASEAANRYPKPESCRSFPGNPGSACQYGHGPVGAILIGDSHAGAIASALAEAASRHGRSILLWEYPACPWLLSAKRVPGLLRSGQECPAFNRWAMQALAGYPPHIPAVLASRTSVYAYGPTERWESGMGRPQVYFDRISLQPDPSFLRTFAQDLEASACALEHGREVFLLRPIPEMRFDVPRTVSRSLAFGRKIDPSIALGDYRERHRLVWEAQDAARMRCGSAILDPLPYLCDAQRCFGAANGRPLYYDSNHLSEFGNKRLTPMFDAVFAGDRRH